MGASGAANERLAVKLGSSDPAAVLIFNNSVESQKPLLREISSVTLGEPARDGKVVFPLFNRLSSSKVKIMGGRLCRMGIRRKSH